MIDCFRCKKMGLFLGDVLFGTAGVRILGNNDAKKLYIGCLTAGLRAENYVMTTASNIQKDAEDILVETREISAQRCQEVPKNENRKKSPERTSEYLREGETASANTVTTQCIIHLGKKSPGGNFFTYSENMSRTVENRGLKQ